MKENQIPIALKSDEIRLATATGAAHGIFKMFALLAAQIQREDSKTLWIGRIVEVRV